MIIKLRRLQFQSNQLPGEVQVVLSDSETRKEAQVWITARFPMKRLSTDRLPLLGLEALDELQRLISEGREDASKEPPAPTQ